jgi:glycine/D-amino acid oxidase-like deaminating enzyme/nitrite reductase/ring-hydroxylating ferredoxin subunit
MTRPAYWMAQADLPKFPELGKDLRVDVCIVGGGMTGVTAAYLLRKAGRSVALLERGRFGGLNTGHTTAHLTQVTDQRLHEMVSRFGRDHAQAAWDAGRAAIELIHDTIHAEKIDCDFAWVPGYLHAPQGQGQDAKIVSGLKEDAQLANELGFDAQFLGTVPFVGTPGVRFPNQARFNPLKYLGGLLKSLADSGSPTFENTEVNEITDSPPTIRANGHEVKCDTVIVATHVPLVGKTGLLAATLFQTKLALYTTYAIAARAPRGTVPDALFWDTADPYRYLRLERHPQNDYLIFGGEDHKTGQDDQTAARFVALEAALALLVPAAAVTHRWSGQVVETHDGLPYIGEIADRQFIATGYSGNGMTLGTLAGMMACDAALGRKNPWKDLFDPHRKKIAGLWDYVKENVDYPYYLVRDRLKSAAGDSLADLKPGEGKLLKLGSDKVAAYRDAKGAAVTLSPVCTHMGCLVHWNKSDSTWDCPCHGSRFKPTGEVLAGPAQSSLEKVQV